MIAQHRHAILLKESGYAIGIYKRDGWWWCRRPKGYNEPVNPWGDGEIAHHPYQKEQLAALNKFLMGKINRYRGAIE